MHPTSFTIQPKQPQSSPRRGSGTGCRVKSTGLYLSVVLYGICLMVWWGCMRDHWTFKDSFGPLQSEDEVQTPTAVQFNYRIRRSHDPNEQFSLPHLKCLGWRQTGGCDSNGKREPENDRACDQSVQGGSSGYCAMVDERTGQEVRMVELNCSSIDKKVTFKCNQAVNFAKFTAEANQVTANAIEKQQRQQLEVVANEANSTVKNGILMVMYPKLLVSVHTSIRLLRSYGCQLPVELWFLESEMGADPMVKHAPLLKSLLEEYGPVSLHPIAKKSIQRFNTKVYATAHTKLTNVLFLDADNVPVRDPTYLFNLPEFQENGAIFWPDFWHSKNTIFNIHEQSLLWQLVGMDFIDMFEQESGQLLINTRKSKAALDVLEFFAYHEPNHFETLKLAHGDKDLYRLAWLKTNTSFHMINYPAGILGMKKRNEFCGITMVQFDPKGEILFLHRNAMKLTGKEDRNQDRVWIQLQTFESDPAIKENDSMKQFEFIKEHYRPGIYGGGRRFPRTGMCYGDYYMKSKHFTLTEWAKTPFGSLEDTLLDFASEAIAKTLDAAGKTKKSDKK